MIFKIKIKTVYPEPKVVTFLQQLPQKAGAGATEGNVKGVLYARSRGSRVVDSMP